MLDQNKVYSPIPDLSTHKVTILGTGAANPTKVYGPGATITRAGTGAYLITWADSPGALIGPGGAGWRATTPADLKGYTVVLGATTAKTVAFVVYNSSFAAADLAAAQWLTLTLDFSPSSVIPA